MTDQKEEEKEKLLELLNQKLVDMTAEEKELQQQLEQLRSKVEAMRQKKFSVLDQLTEQFLDYPSGLVTAKFVLEETEKRCKTLEDIIRKTTTEATAEELVIENPTDEFTMMSDEEVVAATMEHHLENEQSKKLFSEMVQEAQAEALVFDQERTNIVNETKELNKYLQELTEMQQKLYRELGLPYSHTVAFEADEQQAEEPAELTLTQLEEAVNLMTVKTEDDD